MQHAHASHNVACTMRMRCAPKSSNVSIDSKISGFMGTKRVMSSTRSLPTKRAKAGAVSPRAEISYIMIKPDGAIGIVSELNDITNIYP